MDHILARKEKERIANGGLFIWGIGNAVGPSIRELLRRSARPEVLFSPIKSVPKLRDVSPPAVAAWVAGEGLDGASFLLPKHSIVTSRFDLSSPPQVHYALVCFSERPLIVRHSDEKIEFAAITNLLTGRRVGASQVTAVVQPRPAQQHQKIKHYDVAIRAELAYPYFLRLSNPVVLPDAARVSGGEWTVEVFRWVRERADCGRAPEQLYLQHQSVHRGSANCTPDASKSLSAKAAV